jgi:hypothetical protein
VPVVLAVHGGGFRGGSARGNGFERVALDFAYCGFATFNIDYYVAPTFDVLDPVSSAQLAVRYLRANASLYRLDPTKIAAYGQSAGGAIVLILGMLQRPVATREQSLLPGHSPTVQYVISGFAPDISVPHTGQTISQMMVSAFTDPASIGNTAPLVYPPLMLVHGVWDELAPVAGGQAQKSAPYYGLVSPGDSWSYAAAFERVQTAWWSSAYRNETNIPLPVPPSIITYLGGHDFHCVPTVADMTKWTNRRLLPDPSFPLVPNPSETCNRHPLTPSAPKGFPAVQNAVVHWLMGYTEP